MKQPKVSIITVVFNNAEKIEKTIKNVLKQTYENLEYIVVDGASTDGTAEIIKKYAGKVKWISEPDNGIYDAMMKGVRMATGEWVLFRNCGDFFFKPSSIEDIFCKYEDKGEDFILANSRLFKSWGYKDYKPNILTMSYYDSMPVLHPSTFVRRATQLNYPFHLEYRNSADYCFFVETMKAGASYCYFDVTIALVESEVGATAMHFERTLGENIDFLKKMGANSNRIEDLEKAYRSAKIKSQVYKYIPFLASYRKYRMLKNGWMACDKSKTLQDI